jgi:hypothetical protein
MLKTIKPMLIETYTVYQFLKSALPAFGTEKAVEVMITQDEFKDHPAQSFNFRIVRNNHHTFFCNGPAGRFKPLSAFDPDQTQATYAYGCDIRAMAQGGDIDTCILGRREDRSTLIGPYRNSVYVQCNITHSDPPNLLSDP